MPLKVASLIIKNKTDSVVLVKHNTDKLNPKWGMIETRLDLEQYPQTIIYLRENFHKVTIQLPLMVPCESGLIDANMTTNTLWIGLAVENDHFELINTTSYNEVGTFNYKSDLKKLVLNEETCMFYNQFHDIASIRQAMQPKAIKGNS